jgi:hypothetical protein
VAHLLALTLAAAPHQFSGTNSNQGTFCEVALVVRVLVIVVTSGLFTNVDHAVVAAVAITIPMATAGLGDGVARAKFAARASIIVLADTAAAVIVVGVFISIRATDDVVFGLSGWSRYY